MVFEVMKLLKSPSDDMKILAFTWNMARKPQNPPLDRLIPNAENYDLIICSFQEAKAINNFIKKMDDHLFDKGLERVSSTSFWEIFIVVYANDRTRRKVNSTVKVNSK